MTSLLPLFGNELTVFYARQHICYSAYMVSPIRLSVRLSDGCIIEKRLMTNRKLHMDLPLTPRLMTLDDLELL